MTYIKPSIEVGCNYKGRKSFLDHISKYLYRNMTKDLEYIINAEIKDFLRYLKDNGYFRYEDPEYEAVFDHKTHKCVIVPFNEVGETFVKLMNTLIIFTE